MIYSPYSNCLLKVRITSPQKKKSHRGGVNPSPKTRRDATSAAPVASPVPASVSRTAGACVRARARAGVGRCRDLDLVGCHKTRQLRLRLRYATLRQRSHRYTDRQPDTPTNNSGFELLQYTHRLHAARETMATTSPTDAASAPAPTMQLAHLLSDLTSLRVCVRPALSMPTPTAPLTTTTRTPPPR